MGNVKNLDKLEEIFCYRFRDPELLRLALTHSSYANEKRMGKSRCNERLEFLGDAVLELVSSEFLFNHYPDMPEGELALWLMARDEKGAVYESRVFLIEKEN